MVICLFPIHSNISNRVLPEIGLKSRIELERYLASILLVTNHCSHIVAKIIDFHLSNQSSDQIVLFCFEVGKKSEMLNSIEIFFYISPVSSLFRSPEKNSSKNNVIRIYINFQSKFSPMLDCMR